MSPQETVLIIEDEPRFQEELTVALAGQGFAVKNAYDGEAGLRMALDARPSLVVLDLILPKEDGFKVLRGIKEREETKRIPVVVLSNLDEPEHVARSIRLGASSYLLKTNYTLSQIIEKIKAMLSPDAPARTTPH